MARVQLTRPLMWAGVAYAKGDTLNGLTTDEAIGLVSRGHGVDLDGVATVRNTVAASVPNSIGYQLDRVQSVFVSGRQK